MKEEKFKTTSCLGGHLLVEVRSIWTTFTQEKSNQDSSYSGHIVANNSYPDKSNSKTSPTLAVGQIKSSKKWSCVVLTIILNMHFLSLSSWDNLCTDLNTPWRCKGVRQLVTSRPVQHDVARQFVSNRDGMHVGVGELRVWRLGGGWNHFLTAVHMSANPKHWEWKILRTNWRIVIIQSALYFWWIKWKPVPIRKWEWTIKPQHMQSNIYIYIYHHWKYVNHLKPFSNHVTLKCWSPIGLLLFGE